MVLFYLTNASLDIAFGLGWWVLKKATTGIYYTGKYMIYGEDDPLTKEKETNEIMMIEFKKLKDELELIKNKI